MECALHETSSLRFSRRSRHYSTLNTQVEAQKKMFAGDAYQFLWGTPPLRLTLLAPKPAESSLSLWLKELGQSPHSGHSGYCACDAYLQRQRRPTCVARSCQPAAFRYAALCQFLSNTNARADESETKQNKSRYGWVWFG